MASWTIADPIERRLSRRRVPGIPGARLVLLRRGIPIRVVPAGDVAVRLSVGDVLRSDGSIAVLERFSLSFEYDTLLATADRVYLACLASLTVEAKPDDASIQRIAVGAEQLLARLKEIAGLALQRRFRTSEYDGIFGELDQIEADVLADCRALLLAENAPYAVTVFTVADVKSKDGKILTPAERRSLTRVEADQREVAEERRVREFEMRKSLARQEQELNAIAGRLQASMETEREEAKIRLMEKRAEINQKFGIGALPVDVQRELLLAERLALIAISRDPVWANEILERVAAGMASGKGVSVADILRELPQPAGDERFLAAVRQEQVAVLAGDADEGDLPELDDWSDDEPHGSFGGRDD